MANQFRRVKRKKKEKEGKILSCRALGRCARHLRDIPPIDQAFTTTYSNTDIVGRWGKREGEKGKTIKQNALDEKQFLAAILA